MIGTQVNVAPVIKCREPRTTTRSEAPQPAVNAELGFGRVLVVRVGVAEGLVHAVGGFA